MMMTLQLTHSNVSQKTWTAGQEFSKLQKNYTLKKDKNIKTKDSFQTCKNLMFQPF